MTHDVLEDLAKRCQYKNENDRHADREEKNDEVS